MFGLENLTASKVVNVLSEPQAPLLKKSLDGKKRAGADRARK
jgi:hypothetical protein